MRTVGQQLYDYVDDQQGCEHITRNGILISTPDIDWLKAEFTWVNNEGGMVSVFFYSEMKMFTKVLGISSLHDLDELTPGRLMELYYDGLAEIVCFVYLNCIYGMSFRKQGDLIIAENERGHKHAIPEIEKPETPDQFITYAGRYYQLMECNEN
jgi:hypothetical protein